MQRRPARPALLQAGPSCEVPVSAATVDSILPSPFFANSLREADPEIARAVAQELGRQQHEIELIASENIVSRAVLEAQARC